MAGKEGSVAALLAAAKVAAAAGPNVATLLPCLRTLRWLMQSAGCRASLLAEQGPELLQQLLRGCCIKLQDSGQQEEQQQQLAAAAAVLIEAAAWQDEEAKCR